MSNIGRWLRDLRGGNNNGGNGKRVQEPVAAKQLGRAHSIARHGNEAPIADCRRRTHSFSQQREPPACQKVHYCGAAGNLDSRRRSHCDYQVTPNRSSTVTPAVTPNRNAVTSTNLRAQTAHSQQLQTVSEEMLDYRGSLEEEEARNRSCKIYMQATSEGDEQQSMVPCSPHHAQQDSSYHSQDGDYAECYMERGKILEQLHLTRADLEQYELRETDCGVTTINHQQQASYAQSEGYHSYISSSDSAIIATPFLDRLKRENDNFLSLDGPEDNQSGGRGSSASSGSSNDTLKWHGSCSDLSSAATAGPQICATARASVTAWDVARDAVANRECATKKDGAVDWERATNRSVATNRDGAADWDRAPNREKAANNKDFATNRDEPADWERATNREGAANRDFATKRVGAANRDRASEWSRSISRDCAANRDRATESPSRDGFIARSSRIPAPQKHHSESLQLPTDAAYRIAPCGTTTPSQDGIRSPKSSPSTVTVAERVVQLESKYSYSHPDKRNRLPDRANLKNIQKSALLSYYERHQTATPSTATPIWKSEPLLSTAKPQLSVAQPQVRQVPRPRLPTPDQELQDEDHQLQSKATKNWSERCQSSPNIDPGIASNPRICCSGNQTFSPPKLPPKKAHLRLPLANTRLHSPTDLPPPSPPPIVEDEAFVSDEPLPPPPVDIVESSSTDDAALSSKSHFNCPSNFTNTSVSSPIKSCCVPSSNDTLPSKESSSSHLLTSSKSPSQYSADQSTSLHLSSNFISSDDSSTSHLRMPTSNKMSQNDFVTSPMATFTSNDLSPSQMASPASNKMSSNDQLSPYFVSPTSNKTTSIEFSMSRMTPPVSNTSSFNDLSSSHLRMSANKTPSNDPSSSYLSSPKSKDLTSNELLTHCMAPSASNVPSADDLSSSHLRMPANKTQSDNTSSSTSVLMSNRKISNDLISSRLTPSVPMISPSSDLSSLAVTKSSYNHCDAVGDTNNSKSSNKRGKSSNAMVSGILKKTSSRMDSEMLQVANGENTAPISGFVSKQLKYFSNKANLEHHQNRLKTDTEKKYSCNSNGHLSGDHSRNELDRRNLNAIDLRRNDLDRRNSNETFLGDRQCNELYRQNLRNDYSVDHKRNKLERRNSNEVFSGSHWHSELNRRNNYNKVVSDDRQHCKLKNFVGNDRQFHEFDHRNLKNVVSGDNQQSEIDRRNVSKVSSGNRRNESEHRSKKNNISGDNQRNELNPSNSNNVISGDNQRCEFQHHNSNSVVCGDHQRNKSNRINIAVGNDHQRNESGHCNLINATSGENQNNERNINKVVSDDNQRNELNDRLNQHDRLFDDEDEWMTPANLRSAAGRQSMRCYSERTCNSRRYMPMDDGRLLSSGVARHALVFPHRLEPHCPPTSHQLSQSSRKHSQSGSCATLLASQRNSHSTTPPSVTGSYKRTISPSHNPQPTSRVITACVEESCKKRGLQTPTKIEDTVSPNSASDESQNDYLTSRKNADEADARHCKTLPKNYATAENVALDGANKRGCRNPRTQSDPCAAQPLAVQPPVINAASVDSQLEIYSSAGFLSAESGYSSLSLNTTSQPSSPTRSIGGIHWSTVKDSIITDKSLVSSDSSNLGGASIIDPTNNSHWSPSLENGPIAVSTNTVSSSTDHASTDLNASSTNDNCIETVTPKLDSSSSYDNQPSGPIGRVDNLAPPTSVDTATPNSTKGRMSDASSQTDYPPPLSIPYYPAYRRCHLREEIEYEELSQNLARELSPSDKLHQILASTTNERNASDYVCNLFTNSHLTEKNIESHSALSDSSTNLSYSASNTRISKKRFSKSDFSVSTTETHSNTDFSVSRRIMDDKSFTEERVYHARPISAETLNEEEDLSSNEQTFSSANQTETDLTLVSLNQKKEELVKRLDRKLKVLREEEISIGEEKRLNERLGDQVIALVATHATSQEVAKLRLHFQEVGHVTSLLLTLCARLARTDNGLLCPPPLTNEAHWMDLEKKREKLLIQLEEAKCLKESIDKRGEAVAKMLSKYLSDEELFDYRHFLTMKSKLLIDTRHITDKIDFGQKQLSALMEHINN